MPRTKSIYTDLTAERRQAADTFKNIPGVFSGRCPGVGRYDLEVYLDDERNLLGFVFPSAKTVNLNFTDYFVNFSELGEQAEWRGKVKKPVAQIVRYSSLPHQPAAT